MRSLLLVSLAFATTAACLDVDDDVAEVPGTTAAAALTSCVGDVAVSGGVPAYQTWFGFLPRDVSPDQVWVSFPLDASRSQYAAFQVDWRSGRVTWATKVAAWQRPVLLGIMAGATGRVSAVQTPPPPPPAGTSWAKFLVAYAKGVHLAYDNAGTAASCTGAFTPTGTVPAYSLWLGTLPPRVSDHQMYVYRPLDDTGREFAAFQIDLVRSQVTWATKVSALQVPFLVGQMAADGISRVTGIRKPPPPPPPIGTDWLIGFGRLGHFSFEDGLNIGGLPTRGFERM